MNRALTGGNRGIGKEITRQLARQGLHVLVGCRDAEKGRDVADRLLEEGGAAEAIAVEVNRPKSLGCKNSERIATFIRA